MTVSPKNIIQQESKRVMDSLLGVKFSEKEISDKYRYAVGTGKRLRPALTILSCRAVGGNPEGVLPVAAGVELLHKFTLVHDDMVDKDKIRRGRPAFHAKYGWKYGIFMGDFLCARVFTILEKLKPDCNDKTLLECYKTLSDTYNKLCVGELEEIFSSEKKFITEKEHLEIMALKSASLIEASMRLGALLGGGSRGHISMLSGYGRHFALSMQILNDIKDTLGLEERREGEKGSDIREGKWNIALIHAVDNAPKKDGKEVLRIVNKHSSKTGKEIDKVIKILHKTGSIEYAQKKAEENMKKAKASIRALGESDAKEALLALADIKTDKWYWTKD